MEYEEDEETKAKGADRKDIKVLSIDYKGQASGGRNDQQESLKFYNFFSFFIVHR